MVSPESTVAAAVEETDGDINGEAENTMHKLEADTECFVANEGQRRDESEAQSVHLNGGDCGYAKQGTTKPSSEDPTAEELELQSDPKGSTERRLSYELATKEDTSADDILVNKEKEPAPRQQIKQDTRQKKKPGGKMLSRSTSSPSAGARVRLHQSMGLRSIPGMGAANSPLLLRSSLSSSRSGLSASFPSPSRESVSEERPGTSSRMAKLLESEAQTGSYGCPLIGCIPASALKYFVEKEERNKQLSASPIRSASPSPVYEQSGMCICACLQGYVVLTVLAIALWLYT